MNYDTVKLRQFIQDYFSSEELRTLLFDYFRSVHDNLTDGMTKNRYVLLLLEYCHNHGKMPDLLAAIQRERDFFQPDDYMQGQKAPTAGPATPTPITRNPRQIFISHAHQDAEVAKRLAHDLEAHGYDIWIAPDSIRPGEKWVEAINRGLEESGIFVLLLSPDAVASRWVQMETNAAIEFEHEGEMHFYPLMLRACRLPAIWRAFQYISFRGASELGLEQLLSVLEPHAAALKMIRIPSGRFLYGDNKEIIYLDEFWIAKTPITNTEYKRFLDANPKYKVPFADEDWAKPYNWNRRKRIFPDGKAFHPVVLVSWHDAIAYAEWAGMKLPTEEQWEKAARGTNGEEFPWGNEWRENYCNTSEARLGTTSPVGQYSPHGDSPYGCVDMSGNVWEWVDSWWDATQTTRVLCGGSWNLVSKDARVTFRFKDYPNYSDLNIGFRVVSSTASKS